MTRRGVRLTEGPFTAVLRAGGFWQIMGASDFYDSYILYAKPNQLAMLRRLLSRIEQTTPQAPKPRTRGRA